METTALRLNGLILVKPRVFRDDRGWFLETYSEPRYHAAGITCPFVQDNHSASRRGTLRGLHYQSTPGQAKLVRVLRGRIFDVAVDLRPASPTFGEWEGVELDGDQHHQLFIPVGFAHGFCVLSDEAEVAYKVSTPYDGTTESTLAWDDPTIGVAWPLPEPVLSQRDRQGESWESFSRRVRV